MPKGRNQGFAVVHLYNKGMEPTVISNLLKIGQPTVYNYIRQQKRQMESLIAEGIISIDGRLKVKK